MRKKCSNDREKLLKFEAEGQEIAKFLRWLEQFTYSNSERSEQFSATEIRKIIIRIGKNHWNLETCRKS